MAAVETSPETAGVTGPFLAPVESLATEALRAALERRGCGRDGASVELRPRRDGWVVVAFVDPDDPWQVATGALTEVMSLVRAVDPSVRLAGLRLEPLDRGPRSPAG